MTFCFQPWPSSRQCETRTSLRLKNQVQKEELCFGILCFRSLLNTYNAYKHVVLMLDFLQVGTGWTCQKGVLRLQLSATGLREEHEWHPCQSVGGRSRP